ncbi:MAG: GC-type dockerin domain-anchored protein [Phycisphaerales bacterium]
MLTTNDFLRVAMAARRIGILLVVLAASLAGPARALAQTTAWFFYGPSGPQFRSGARLAYDSARGVTVFFGGYNNSFNNDTWEWNGTTWTQRVVSGPAPRTSYAMAYDSARGVSVLYGGTGPTNYGDTWEWNGTTWTQRPVSGPGNRYQSALAYDSARGVSVFFGGFDGGWWTGDTWEWNGTTWTQRLVSGPSIRASHAMAYDSARGVTVLFGGFFNGTPNAETWEWNGTSWTQRLVSGPSPRGSHSMTYDSVRGVTVLFGGLIAGGFVNNETWEWDGTTWTQRTISSPAARHNQGMAFDSARAATVMFGGDTGVFYLFGTSELKPCTAASITTQPTPQSVCPANPATFSITASGSAPISYQWQKRINNVYTNVFDGNTGYGGMYSGAQTPTLTISAVFPGDLELYRCVISNPCATVNSSEVALAFTPDASIAMQPGPQSPCFGGTATFSVTASPISLPYTYQWQKRNPIFVNVYNDIFNGPTGNGGTYGGTQTDTLTINGVFPNDLGEFRCVVNAPCQSIISNDASLYGPPSPVVTSGPIVTSGCAGGTGVLSITADPLGSTYQWQRYVGPCVLCYVDVANGPTGNGGTLSGAQSPTLTLTGLNLFDTFVQYRCIVTGPCPNTPLAASADTFFTITDPPLAAAPAPSEVCPGGTVSISMNTQNVTSFLWEYYSTPLSIWIPISDGPFTDFPAGFSCTFSGTATDTITLSNTFLGAPTSFRFSGGNICQILAPIQASLDYAGPPVITTHPVTTNYCHGQPSSFTVGASSQLPLTYQWQLFHFALNQWINLNDGFYIGGATGLSGTISGSLTPTLTFTLATVGTVAPNQPFRCIVSNGCQQATSNSANLHICIADVTCDGIITSQDFFDFLTAFFGSQPAADVNTDFQVNSQDYFDFLTAFFNGC